MDDVDVLIITALQEELDAVLNLKEGGKASWGEPKKTPDNFLYYTTEFIVENGRKLIFRATTQWRMGPTVAASTAAKMLSFTKPRIACMVGICAGWRQKGIEFGDVVVPERTFFYDIGKLKEGNFNPENLVYALNANLIQWIKDFDSNNKEWISLIKTNRPLSIRYQKEWVLFQLWKWKDTESHVWPNTSSDIEEAKKHCPEWKSIIEYLRKEKLIRTTNPLKLTVKGIKFVENLRANLQVEADKGREEPKSWIGVLATGNPVVEDTSIFDRLAERDRKVLGLETEAAAFLQEVQSTYPGLPSFVIKGVCDYADIEKSDLFHIYAAETSAQYTFQLIKYVVNWLDNSPVSNNSFNNNISETVAKVSKSLETIKGLPESIDQIKLLITQVISNSNSSIPSIQLPSADKPPLRPRIFANRTEKFNKLKEMLSGVVWLNLTGSTGMGKTHLAGLIAEEVGLEKIIWVSIRTTQTKDDLSRIIDLHLLREAISSNSTELIRKYFSAQLNFSQLVQKAISSPTPKSFIIIDDLPDLLTQRAFYDKLIELITTLAELNCKLLTTSQRGVPSPAFLLNEQLKIAEEKITSLEEEDLNDLLKNINAPQIDQNLILLILAKTHGHPFLVSAVISYLINVDWKINEEIILSILAGDPLSEIEIEIKRQILSLLPKEEMRELLYRLSLVNIPFGLNLLAQIARVPEIINKPQEIFFELTGPWINKLNSNLFEVSPLIKNIGEDLLELPAKKNSHFQIAKYFLELKLLDETKILHILSHLIRSEVWEQLGIFILTLSFNVTKPFQAESLEFITYFFKDNWPINMPLRIRIIIRSFQVSILGILSKDAQKEITELENLSNQFYNSDDEILLSTLVLLSQLQLIKPWNKAFSPGLIARKTLQILRRLQSLSNQPALDIKSVLSKTSLAPNIWMGIQRIKSRNDIREILQVLKDMSDDERREALSDELVGESASLFVDQCWGIEVKKNPINQDWDGVLLLLNEVDEIAQMPGGEQLKALVHRAKAITLAENLGKIEDGINLIKQYLNDEQNEEQFIYKYTLGTIHYDNNDFELALIYFKQSILIKTNYTALLISCAKLASVTAGKLAKWDDMKYHAILAIRLINKLVKNKKYGKN